MPLVGRYINLDRATERRHSLEAHLASLNPPQSYRWFAAVDAAALGLTSEHISPGNVGCYHSHRAVLREHLDYDAHLHILEDDAGLAINAPHFLAEAAEIGPLRDHDLLFSDSALPPLFTGAHAIRRRFHESIRRGPRGEAAGLTFTLIRFNAGTSSYLVNRASVGRLHDLLDAEITPAVRVRRPRPPLSSFSSSSSSRGPALPIDLQISQWGQTGILRVACLFPFVSTVRLGEFDSTIDCGIAPKARLASDLVRYSYFVERDIGTAQILADRYLAVSPAADLWTRLHVQIAGFVAGEDYDAR
jgi:hypothetical protein